MIYEDIDKALNIPLKQFGDDNSIDVDFENIDYPTDNENPFLSGINLPALVEQGDLAVNEFRNGIYQIDVRIPKSSGKPEANRWADKLNAVFKTGTTFFRGDICLQVTSFEVGPMLIEGGWARLPCSVNWETFTNRL